jgi:hypothetical protein
MQQITLLLPREVADDPTDRVHLAAVFRAVLLSCPRQSATPLGPREPELLDQRVCQSEN